MAYGVFVWCERRDSNSHGRPLAPKASASTNSATLANYKDGFVSMDPEGVNM